MEKEGEENGWCRFSCWTWRRWLLEYGFESRGEGRTEEFDEGEKISGLVMVAVVLVAVEMVEKVVVLGGLWVKIELGW